MKCSTMAYLSVWAIAVVAASVLWNVARLAGLLGRFQRLVGQFTSNPGLRLRGAPILAASSVVGAVLVILGSVLNGVAVAVFNLSLDVVGGVKVSVSNHRTGRRRWNGRGRLPYPRRDDPAAQRAALRHHPLVRPPGHSEAHPVVTPADWLTPPGSSGRPSDTCSSSVGAPGFR